jgi:hypothetical protein
MEYFNDFYPRLYYFTVYLAWWLWIAQLFLSGFIAGDVTHNKHKDANSIKYQLIIGLVLTFFTGIAVCIFLPSPEFFGLVEIDLGI